MSKLTLDDAIKHCLEVAEQNDTQAEKIGRQLIGSAIDKYATDCRECAAEHRQLAEWLRELKEAKRLLKMAVEDMNSNNICYDINACNVCTEKNCISCDTFHWRYTDEAEKLLKDEK